MKLWFRVLGKLQLEKWAGVLKWIVHDPDLEPARLDERFKQWVWRGITSYCSITSNGNLLSFQAMSDTFRLEKQDTCKLGITLIKHLNV